MRTVLVTGAIGSGKSALCRHLSTLGYPVYDCDSRCKGLYDSVPGLVKSCEKACGLPFARWGELFGDAEALGKLEGVVYPVLREDFLAWRESVEGELCFVESAVAAEKEAFEGLFDEVWLVRAPYSVRLARNPKAAARSGLQNFDDLKPTRIFENDSTLENLYSQL